MLRSEYDKLKRVIVCSPQTEYFKINDLKVHNITELADIEKAKRQHDELKSLLKKSGAEVIDIPELSEHPNSVFTRDTALITPYGYIKLKMGLNTRKGEEDWMENILRSINEPKAGEIKEPGNIEGGDIILADNVAFIGKSGRTNDEGVKQISELLTGMNYELRTSFVTEPYLHIGGAMSVIGNKRILCCAGVFKQAFFKDFEKIEIPCHEFVSGNVICLGDNEVIADSSNIITIKELETNGLTVHAIDLSEFIKGTGGPTCLILPVERNNI